MRATQRRWPGESARTFATISGSCGTVSEQRADAAPFGVPSTGASEQNLLARAAEGDDDEQHERTHTKAASPRGLCSLFVTSFSSRYACASWACAQNAQDGSDRACLSWASVLGSRPLSEIKWAARKCGFSPLWAHKGDAHALMDDAHVRKGGGGGVYPGPGGEW